MGLTAFRRIQLGKETAPGTAVPATAKLMGFNLKAPLADRQIVQPEEERGSLAGAFRSYTQSVGWTGATLSGDATFEDILYLLAMAIKGGVVPTGTGTAKTWAFEPSLTAANNPDTFTLEFGDDTQAYEAEYVLATSLEISGGVGQALKCSANLVGRQLTATTFTPALADRVVESALAAKTNLYLDDSGGMIGTTLVPSTLLDWTWRLPEHFVTIAHQGSLYFTAVREQKMKPTLEMTVEFNTGVAALRAKYLAETRQLVRLKAEGSEVETGTKKSLSIDGAYKIIDLDVLDERNGADIVKLTLHGEYDPTWAKLFKVEVVNGVSTLA